MDGTYDLESPSEVERPGLANHADGLPGASLHTPVGSARRPWATSH